MIIEGLCNAFFKVVDFIINLLPVVPQVAGAFGVLLDLIGYGLYFFGGTLFAHCIANFMAWAVIDIAWATTEWCYRKIPGIS